MASSEPAVTIVIPTRDRPTPLRATVEAIMRLEPPVGGFETVVIDDGGSADLGFLDRFPELRWHRQAGAGPATARNTGAAMARGRYLAFTDDDCQPAADWLIKLQTALECHPDALIGGRTVNGLVDNPFSEASQQLTTFLYDWANNGESGPRFFASNNIGMAGGAFAAMGGFDPSFSLPAGEDRAFCDTWRASGRPLVYAPDAVIIHHHHLTAGRFWRQHLRYGRGAFHLRKLQVAASGAADRSLADGRGRFTAALLAHPFRTERPVPARSWPWFQAALLAGSQAATATGYLLAWLERPASP